MYDYVKTFRGKSISTQDWQSHLFSYFGKQSNGAELTEKLSNVNWDAWLRGTGLDLPVNMEYDTTLADAAYSLAAKWDEARKKGEMHFKSSDLDNFTSSQTGKCRSSKCIRLRTEVVAAAMLQSAAGNVSRDPFLTFDSLDSRFPRNTRGVRCSSKRVSEGNEQVLQFRYNFECRDQIALVQCQPEG